MNKMWYTSKTLWINLLAVIGILFTGVEFSPETTAIIMAVLNALLRVISKKKITW